MKMSALFLLVLRVVSYVVVCALVPLQAQEVVKKVSPADKAELEQLTDAAKQDLERILGEPEYVPLVIELKRLLEVRLEKVQLNYPEAEIAKTDEKILRLLSKVEKDKQHKVLDALEELWDYDVDYWTVIEPVFVDIERHRVALGPLYPRIVVWPGVIKKYKPLIIKRRPPHPRTPPRKFVPRHLKLYRKPGTLPAKPATPPVAKKPPAPVKKPPLRQAPAKPAPPPPPPRK